MRPGIFTGQVQQGGASSLGGLFESSTGVNGEKIFQIMNGGSPIFYAYHGRTTAAHPSTVGTDTVPGSTTPLTMASMNNTNATCSAVMHRAGANTQTQFSFYSERYDDADLNTICDVIGIARDPTMNGTYVFGDLTITVVSSTGTCYILYETATDGLIAFEQWGYAGTGSSRTVVWPYSGTAPSHFVATPYDTYSASADQAVAVTRDVNALGTVNQAVSMRFVNTGFLGDAGTGPAWYAFYSKGSYSVSYGSSTLETGTGYIKFIEGGVTKRVVTGYQNNTGTTAYQIISFPTSTITSNPARVSMCTGAPNRKVCMTVDISTSQCQYKTWDRTLNSAQGVNIIAMEHLGS